MSVVLTTEVITTPANNMNCSNLSSFITMDPELLNLCAENIWNDPTVTEFPLFLQVVSLVIGIPVIAFGCVGNMMTLFILLKTRVLQTPFNVFLVSLSLSDIFHCTIIIPIQITVYMNTGSEWPFSDTFCKVYPFLNLTFVGATMGCLSATAVGRHFKIIYPSIYSRFFNKRRKTATIAMICWFLPIIFQLPPLIGFWGEFGYEDKLLTCGLVRGEKDSGMYGTFFIFTTLVLPISIIIFSYLRIFCVVRANHRRVANMRQQELMTPHHDSQKTPNQANREDIRFTKMMMCIFLVCIVCYFPYLIVNISDRNVDNLITINLASMCIWFSASLNPVVYVLMNRHFRKAFMKLLPQHNSPFQTTQWQCSTVYYIRLLSNCMRPLLHKFKILCTKLWFYELLSNCMRCIFYYFSVSFMCYIIMVLWTTSWIWCN